MRTLRPTLRNTHSLVRMDSGAGVIRAAAPRPGVSAGLCLGEARPAHAGPHRQVPLLINRAQPLRRSVLHADVAGSECVSRYVPVRVSPGRDAGSQLCRRRVGGGQVQERGGLAECLSDGVTG